MRRPPVGQVSVSKSTPPTKKVKAGKTAGDRKEKPSRPTKAQRTKDSVAAAARREYREAVRARKSFEKDEARRFTAHLRRRRIVILSVIGAVVALAIFIGVGVFSPLMALKNITVAGTHRVDAAAITTELTSQLGRPLPLVDTTAVRDVLARQPLIKSFSLQSIPPDTLIVNVVERAPIGYLATSHGFALVDPAGVAIEVTPSRVKNYPVIDVTGASATSTGFPAAVSVLLALPTQVRSMVDTIRALSLDNVVLTLSNSRGRVVWGSADKSATKTDALIALMKRYKPRANIIYDVSSPSSVVVH